MVAVAVARMAINATIPPAKITAGIATRSRSVRLDITLELISGGRTILYSAGFYPPSDPAIGSAFLVGHSQSTSACRIPAMAIASSTRVQMSQTRNSSVG